MMEYQDMEDRLGPARELVDRARREIGVVVVGQEKMIDGLLMGILAGGHVLLEGVPGLAKTLAVKSLAQVTQGSFKRIQFTPDLLPADLTGTMVYRQESGQFLARRGPIFSNIILADEINRAPAKVQSALLEAMEERQVTIGETTFPLPDPFFVLATQNPLEHEGTYPLPEAQLDRFLMKIRVEYPNPREELEILRRVGVDRGRSANRVFQEYDLRRIREAVSLIDVDERIEAYIVALVGASRMKSKGPATHSRYIEYGASPRATIFIYRCAKVQAFFEGRRYVIPEDVKAVAPAVLRHRIILSYEAEADELSADDIIKNLLSAVPVP